MGAAQPQMESTYFYCAAIGGGVMVLQTLLLILGGDADIDADVSTDVDAHAAGDGSGILFQLSLKTVVAFVTFFGLTGLACVKSGLPAGWTLTWAIVAGAAAFFLVGYLMDLLLSLQSQGNVRLEEAVGVAGRVDLRIPAQRSGCGKVRVAVGGRTLVQKAITGGAEIPTGAEVVVRALRGGDTFEVALPEDN